jgi:predicted DNA-binding antitoxin AbrB/MazE fold protein
MRKVRLTTGNIYDIKLIVQDISFPEQENKSEIVNGWEENENSFIPSTLRDISIVINSMVGCGVIKQLANELSDKLNLDNPKMVKEKLSEILREYSQLSEEEANKRWENLGNYDEYED